MANTIILKKSSVAAKVPLVGDLVYGELALNYADGLLYYKTAGNSIASLGGGSGFTGGTVANVTTFSNTVTMSSDIVLNSRVFAGGTTGTNGQVLLATGTGVQWSTLSSTFNGGTITSPLVINNTTAATSTNTGALQVVGGVGIGGSLYVGGIVTATNVFIGPWAVSTSTGGASFTGGTVANTTTFVSTVTMSSDLVLSSRVFAGGNVGTNGQVLTSTGAGVQWSASGGGVVFTLVPDSPALTVGVGWASDNTAPGGVLRMYNTQNDALITFTAVDTQELVFTLQRDTGWGQANVIIDGLTVATITSYDAVGGGFLIDVPVIVNIGSTPKVVSLVGLLTATPIVFTQIQFTSLAVTNVAVTQGQVVAAAAGFAMP
jgi:hypothetical protein